VWSSPEVAARRWDSRGGRATLQGDNGHVPRLAVCRAPRLGKGSRVPGLVGWQSSVVCGAELGVRE
jgi:hypothetical protein